MAWGRPLASELHNNWMKLTKPALVKARRGLCSLSRCSTDMRSRTRPERRA